MKAGMKEQPGEIPEDRTLEISGEQFREWTGQALDYLQAYVTSLPSQPMGSARAAGAGDATAPVMAPEPVPHQGVPLDRLLEDLFQRAIPGGFNTASPGYLGYIPGGGILHAALADFIAAAVNRYVGVYVAAPELVALEAQVLLWFAQMTGLPATARGILTSGGSMANFTAVVTARSTRLPENFLGGVLYVSDQTHHSVAKAARMAGFPVAAVRQIPSDELWCMRVDDLKAAIDQDRAAGRTPFMVVASAGTTNTGAVDDLPGLARLCAREQLWFHVDAAYGGFFCLTKKGKKALAGMEKADSITMDPHKGLFLPYGTGALLVRDGELLRRAHSTTADYMPATQETTDPLVQDFCEYGPELSRSFRGLRIWLPLKLHGIAPFIANLEEKLALTLYAADALRAMENMEILAEPQLSIVAFRLTRQGFSAAATNDLNRRLLARIQAHDRVFLTATNLRGVFALRICVLSFRTHKDRIDETLGLIAREAAGLGSQPAIEQE
ncbi:MAG: aminotransferase class V-fold PLP-dependent enzyme [Acidobacteria bacterium]|nr:MAG: aminotransferase class V-fold PLP-dependent enzyme [Acidobacteriota bacterium]